MTLTSISALPAIISAALFLQCQSCPAAPELDSGGSFLAIDATAFESTEGLSLSLVEARKHLGNPILRNRPGGPDAWRAGFPWVLADAGRFRMWYMARDSSGRYYTCYAESPNGYDWHYPRLGLVEHEGSKANNICFAGHALMTTILRDDAASDPEKRYVGVIYGQISRPHLTEAASRHYSDNQPSIKGLAFSRDGLNWRQSPSPLFPIPAKVEGGTLIRMPTEWLMVHQQNSGEFPHVHRSSRFLRVSASKDLEAWLLDDRPAFFFDQRFNGALQTHVTPGYINHGNVLVAAQGMLYDNEELVDHETDLTLLVSNDGHAWRQPKPAQPLSYLLRRGDQHSWDRSFIVQGNLVNAGAKTLLYYNGSQWGNVDADGIQVGVAELRLDGYGSLAPKIGWNFGKPGPFSGRLITKPVQLLVPRLRLFLNVQRGTAEGDTVRAALLDEHGVEIPGYGLADCGAVAVDSVGVPATWNDVSDLSRLAGRRVKVAVEVTSHNPDRTGKVRRLEPQIYALYFSRPKLWLGRKQEVFGGGVERHHISDPNHPALDDVDLAADAATFVELTQLTGESANLTFTGDAQVTLAGANLSALEIKGVPVPRTNGSWTFRVSGTTMAKVVLAQITPR